MCVVYLYGVHIFHICTVAHYKSTKLQTPKRQTAKHQAPNAQPPNGQATNGQAANDPKYTNGPRYIWPWCLGLYPTVPSVAVLSGTTSPSSTAITITGSVPSGSVVTGFVVRWQRDTSVGCSDEDEDTISETGAFPNSYQISGLELGNRYTITVTVSNAAGTAPASNSVTGTTLETGERESSPRSVLTTIFFSPQLPVMVQSRSQLVLSQPTASQSSGRRCPVSTVMER